MPDALLLFPWAGGPWKSSFLHEQRSLNLSTRSRKELGQKFTFLSNLCLERSPSRCGSGAACPSLCCSKGKASVSSIEEAGLEPLHPNRTWGPQSQTGWPCGCHVSFHRLMNDRGGIPSTHTHTHTHPASACHRSFPQSLVLVEPTAIIWDLLMDTDAPRSFSSSLTEEKQSLGDDNSS